MPKKPEWKDSVFGLGIQNNKIIIFMIYKCIYCYMPEVALYYWTLKQI